MNEVIAENIRRMRERRSWTQEHLAKAASVEVRTVQRVERGLGVSAETLLALSSVFDVDIDVLRADQTVAKQLGLGEGAAVTDIEKKLTEIVDRYGRVQMTVVKRSADLHSIFDAEVLQFQCRVVDEPLQNKIAELKQYFSEVLDLHLEPAQQPDAARDAFKLVKELEMAGVAVSVAVSRRVMSVLGTRRRPWRVLYIVVAPVAEPCPMVLYDKTQDP